MRRVQVGDHLRRSHRADAPAFAFGLRFRFERAPRYRVHATTRRLRPTSWRGDRLWPHTHPRGAAEVLERLRGRSLSPSISSNGESPKSTDRGPMRPHLDRCAVIDWACPAIRESLPLDRPNAGIWTWRFAGGVVARAAFNWTPDGPAQLVIQMLRDGARTAAIDVTWSRPYFGGRRPWFICPQSAQAGLERRARMLVLTPGGRWVSRGASRALYRSQLEYRPVWLRALVRQDAISIRSTLAAEARAGIRRLRRDERRRADAWMASR